MSDERDPENEADRKPDGAPQPEAVDRKDDQPLTGEPVARMRLRPEPPRVTRLSRKVLRVSRGPRVGCLMSTDLPGGAMTATDEMNIISEALAVIDRGLAETQHRELVSASEVADLLLDLRLLLMASGEVAEPTAPVS